MQENWQPKAARMVEGGMRRELKAVREMARRGDLSGAMQKLSRLMEERPELAHGHLFMGNIYLRMRNLDEAAKCFEKALALNPRMARATLGLGQVFRQRKNLSQAKTLFDRAVELDPKLTSAKVQLASLLREQGDRKGAEKALDEALEVNPQDVPSRLMLAAIYADEHRNADAARIFEDMLQDKPDQEIALVRLGLLRLREKRMEDAAVLFGRAVEAKPDNPLPHFLLGVARYRLGSIDAATQKFRETLRHSSNFRPATYLLADCLIDTKHYLEAIDLLRQVIARSPKKNSAHQRLAEIYMRQERYDFALREYRAALLCDEKLPLAEPKLLDLVEAAAPVESRVRSIQQILKRLREDGLPDELQEQMRDKQRERRKRFQRNRRAMGRLPEAGDDSGFDLEQLPDEDGSETAH